MAILRGDGDEDRFQPLRLTVRYFPILQGFQPFRMVSICS